MEHNIYFTIQPLHYVSRILGLSPFHVDPNYTFRNKGGCTFCHIIQATIMILLLLYGLLGSVLTIIEYSEPTFYVSIRVVWIINILVSNFTGILALIFAVTRNRNHMSNLLCLLSRIDNMLLSNKPKQNVYSHQRSRIIMQLWITILLFGTVYIPAVYSYSDGTWTCYINMCSQAFRTAIDTVIILQYINIVLMVRQRYQLLKHLLTEAAHTDDVNSSRHMDTQRLRSQSSNKIFSMATSNLESDTNFHKLYTIRDLRLICSELCDVLHSNNKSYEVLLLFDVIAILTTNVITAYSGVITIKRTILEYGCFQLYLKVVTNLSECAFMLFTLLWLTMCCQKTTEEFNDIFICIRKLLLYPNTLGWSTSELKGFASQLKNSKFEFNVCGFFTLNLQFFCASVSAIVTYILVLNQLS